MVRFVFCFLFGLLSISAGVLLLWLLLLFANSNAGNKIYSLQMNCQYSFICFFLFIWNPERFTFTLFWHYYTCENKFKKKQTNRKHQYSHTDECEAKREKTKFKVISCFSSLLSKAPRQKRFRPEIEFNEKKSA